MANINLKELLIWNNITDGFEALTINYITETGHGTFTVKMYDFFPATSSKLKIIIDMIRRSNNPEEPATVLYNYLVKCEAFYKKLASLNHGVNDQEKEEKARTINAVKKYTSNIEALLKAFNFFEMPVVSEDEKPVEMKSENNIVLMIHDRTKNNNTIANYKGYRFIKFNKVFHVFKEGKTVKIVLPETGRIVLKYNGGIKTAPEYITADVIEILNKLDLKAFNDQLLEVCKDAENVILNNDIYLREEETPEEEPTPTPEAPETVQEITPPEVESPRKKEVKEARKTLYYTYIFAKLYNAGFMPTSAVYMTPYYSHITPGNKARNKITPLYQGAQNGAYRNTPGKYHAHGIEPPYYTALSGSIQAFKPPKVGAGPGILSPVMIPNKYFNSS